jgi:Mrp family chromosome partitioning ATPase/capsular polysaccharide biosynthesis protein
MTDAESPIRSYLEFARRQWLLLVIVPAFAVTIAAVVVFRAQPVYRASMKVIVAQAGGQTQTDFGSQALSQTMKNLFESDVVARKTINRLSLDATPPDLLKHVKVSFKPDSSVLDISYDSTSRRQAVVVLGEMARVFERTVDEKLGIRSGQAALTRPTELPVIVAKVFDPPHLEPKRVSPTPVKSLGFAAAFGLALGLVLAFAREGLDARMRNRRDAEKWFGAPVLGTLPKGTCGKPPPRLRGSGEGRYDAVVEAMRSLSANFLFSEDGYSQERPGGKAVLVTSAVHREGKTTVSANLSVELALAGKEIICVEADFRRPRLHRHLGLSPEGVGLADVLEGRATVEEALRPVELVAASENGSPPRAAARGNGSEPHNRTSGQLHVLTTGRTPLDPGSLLTQEAVESLLRELRDRADYVILDSPPLLAVADALPLALQADSVLVIGRQGRTTPDKAEAVRATLEGLGVRKIAVILTDTPREVGYAYA